MGERPSNARTDSARAAAGVFSVAAGAIHAAAAGGHDAGGSLVAGFALTAAAQLVGGVWLVAARSRPAATTVAVVNAIGVLAWVGSRTVGLPVGGELGDVEAIGGQDLAAAAAGASVLGLLTLGGRRALADRSLVHGALLMSVGLGVFGVMSDHEHGSNRLDQSVPWPEAGTLSDRLPPTEAVALLGLSARPVMNDGHAHAHGEDGGHGGGYEQPPPPVELSGEEAVRFENEWAAAVEVSRRFSTVEAAAAVGYVQAAPPVPGVGSHWVKWSLVDRPFDPAEPSMLLFDAVTAGRPPRLVGLSYWVASADEPEGFAGPNDEWHTHQGMCFVNGWLRDEGVEQRAGCDDVWIDGVDLWMLHAWTIDDLVNPWGPFAAVNPRLCRRPSQTPDALTCDPVGI